MNQTLIERLDGKIEAKSLLKHPFYRDWTAGKLTLSSLQAYAAQYYQFEVAFPTFLSAIHSRCPVPWVRQVLLSNLWDEEHGGRNHPALWLRFCSGLGLGLDSVQKAQVFPETHGLVNTLRAIVASRPFPEGIAALYAYERQVPAVAARKVEGLREFYGIEDSASLEFFTLHMGLDEEHAASEARAIASHASEPHQELAVLDAADEALDALWRFLDGVYHRC